MGCHVLKKLREVTCENIPAKICWFRHADYQMGNTSPVLMWKDESCSQYVIGIDNKGQVPNQQQSKVDNGGRFESRFRVREQPFGCGA
uniref:Uncharacterized protein n=1 Tax=Helianthus annuus TaxID=4232 RepID=A0A251TIP2_HELAN